MDIYAYAYGKRMPFDGDMKLGAELQAGMVSLQAPPSKVECERECRRRGDGVGEVQEALSRLRSGGGNRHATGAGVVVRAFVLVLFFVLIFGEEFLGVLLVKGVATVDDCLQLVRVHD